MTFINSNILRDFITTKFSGEKITQQQAQEYGIDKSEFDEADTSADTFLDVDEILENDDLYEQFAVMYETETAKDDSLDEEKEKEKNNSVKGTGGAGI